MALWGNMLVGWTPLPLLKGKDLPANTNKCHGIIYKLAKFKSINLKPKEKYKSIFMAIFEISQVSKK
jgi:hypothetical protein